MLTLEEVMRRFTARDPAQPPDTAIEPIKPRQDQAPVVINGMQQLLAYLADLNKRLSDLEETVKHLKMESR